MREDLHWPAKGDIIAEVSSIDRCIFDQLELSFISLIDILLGLLDILLLGVKWNGQFGKSI